MHLSMPSCRNWSIDSECNFKVLSCDKKRSVGKRKLDIIDIKEKQ